ncbi:MAG: hypothetical protein GF311_21870 [Candidatus Lokiarchaeota archaeon]|nr:hypothetical protein [Candidatus Lokiarchaeota archaeon]
MHSEHFILECVGKIEYACSAWSSHKDILQSEHLPTAGLSHLAQVPLMIIHFKLTFL